MRSKHLISALGVAVLMTLPPVAAHAAAAASGTGYFDLSGLTTELQQHTLNFGGWSYTSNGTATVGSVSDVRTLSSPDLSASVGNTKVHTGAGRVAVETGTGGSSQSYQEMRATVQLAAGQHFLYSVAYTMDMQKALAAARVDLGAGFIIDSAVGGYTIDRTVSTLDWTTPVGSGSVANVFELDLYNPYDTPLTYTVRGWLGAADASPASAVPEPATYLLLLLGLTTLGVAARRRAG
jgi:hypothetical protein